MDVSKWTNTFGQDWNALKEVDGESVGAIGKGLCVLIGISRDDTRKDMEFIARKILSVRVFENNVGKKWDKSVKEMDLEILCISQFTLYHILKGNKLDFHNAMPADKAEPFYNEFLSLLKSSYLPNRIKDGKFGAYMQVHIENDGPVTIELETKPEPSSTKSSSIS